MEIFSNNSPLWKIEGETEWRNGNIQERLSEGTYRIIFRDIENYVTPEPQIITIEKNKMAHVNAIYKYVGTEAIDINHASSSQLEENNPNKDILHFVASENNSKIWVCGQYYDMFPQFDIEYSLDDCSTWKSVKETQIREFDLKNIGDTIYFRGNEKTIHNFRNRDDNMQFYFRMEGKISAYGSIISLLDKANQLLSLKKINEQYFNNNAEYQYNRTISFSGLFNRCTSLIKAPELPFIDLTPYAYCGMFSGCTNLIEPPELPALILDNSCYDSMFANCKALKKCLRYLQYI